MPKANNVKQIASLAQRQYAAGIATARKNKAEWGNYEATAKEGLTDTLKGKVDVTLVTEAGDEVASITESEPKTDAVDWVAYRKAHPELEKEFEKFYKPASTTVTILTKWVEQPTQIPPAVSETTEEAESEAS